MYHSLFIHLSVDGHLGCFHVLAILNSAAVNNRIICVFFSYGFLRVIFSVVGLLDHMIVLFQFFFFFKESL